MIDVVEPWDLNDPKIQRRIFGDFYADSTRKGGCYDEACRLWRENDFKGAIYLVNEVNGTLLHHYYYIPDLTKLDVQALNQKDNGYEGYPALTVKQVLRYGRLIHSLDVLMDFIREK